MEENDPMELIQTWKGNVKGADIIKDSLNDTESKSTRVKKVHVKNTYFEWVPAQFVHAYVTDEGLWSVEDITKRSSWVGEQVDRFFKEL